MSLEIQVSRNKRFNKIKGSDAIAILESVDLKQVHHRD